MKSLEEVGETREITNKPCVRYPAYLIDLSVIEPIEHQSFDRIRQSNLIQLTLKFDQWNKIERSIDGRSTIDQNRTFDYRTVDRRTQSNVR